MSSLSSPPAPVHAERFEILKDEKRESRTSFNKKGGLFKHYLVESHKEYLPFALIMSVKARRLLLHEKEGLLLKRVQHLNASTSTTN